MAEIETDHFAQENQLLVRFPSLFSRYPTLNRPNNSLNSYLLGRLSQPTGVLGAHRLRWVRGPFMDSFRLAEQSGSYLVLPQSRIPR